MDSLVQSLDVVRQIIVNVKMDDPAKVVYAIKQLFREAAAGKRERERGGEVGGWRIIHIYLQLVPVLYY